MWPAIELSPIVEIAPKKVLQEKKNIKFKGKIYVKFKRKEMQVVQSQPERYIKGTHKLNVLKL